MSVWLITGGAGFIGSNFVHHLAARPHARLLILDALTYAGNLATIAHLIDGDRIRFVRADVRDAAAIQEVFANDDIECVVHFAAESHVDRSIAGPRAFVETNVTGTLNLLTAAHGQWRESSGHRRFLHISTDEVYGALSADDPPCNERSPYAPNNPYAATKAAADHLVRAWHRTYGLPAIITNCTNNYGPWQFPEKLIPLMILNAVGGRELPVYGDGLQIRDWLHVRDHCEALQAVLERGVVGETYCIGGNDPHPNLHVVRSVCDIVDAELGRKPGTARACIRHVVDRPAHDRRYSLDCMRMHREVGWSPQLRLADALPAVVRWYLSQGAWLEGIRSGEYLRFYEQQYRWRLRANT